MKSYIVRYLYLSKSFELIKFIKKINNNYYGWTMSFINNKLYKSLFKTLIKYHLEFIYMSIPFNFFV